MQKGSNKERINVWKDLAEIFLKENKRVFVVDVNGTYYFADLLLVGDDTLTIQCFSPKDKEGMKIVLYWISVVRFEEYREER